MSVSKKQLFEEIIAIVFENKDTFKEGDYITLNEKLMKLYNEVNGVNGDEVVEDEVVEDEDEVDPGFREFVRIVSNRLRRNRVFQIRSARWVSDFFKKTCTMHQIRCILCHTLEKVHKSNGDGYTAVDINLYTASRGRIEIHEYYEHIKRLIPLLQSRGFDCKMYYQTDNVFNESSFNGIFNVAWTDNRTQPSSYMRNKIQYFPKTRDKYYFDDIYTFY